MANLADLFRYKAVVEVNHPTTGKLLWKGWVRILGDEDNEEAARNARIASAASRKALRTPESAEYIDTVEQVEATDRDALIQLIAGSENSKFLGEAFTNVDREDVTKMEEVAVLPDAPTLEEQEKYDAIEEEKATKYRTALEEYITGRRNAVIAELEALSEEDLRKKAREALSIIIPTSAYLTELQDQKIFRGTYKDEACTKREFTDIDSYRNTHESIKKLLKERYQELEMSPDDIKN